MASGTDRINKILSNAGTVTTSGTPTNTGAARIDSILRNVGKVSVDETAFKTLSQPSKPPQLPPLKAAEISSPYFSSALYKPPLLSPLKAAEMASPYFSSRLTQDYVDSETERINKEIAELRSKIDSYYPVSSTYEEHQAKADLQSQIRAKEAEIAKLKSQLFEDEAVSIYYTLDKGTRQLLDRYPALTATPVNVAGSAMMGNEEQRKQADLAILQSKKEVQRLKDTLAAKGYNQRQIERLLAYVQQKADAEELEMTRLKAEKYASEHPVIASIESVGTNLLSGFGVVDALAQNIKNVITGYDIPVNYAGGPFQMAAHTDAIRGQVQKDIAEATPKLNLMGQNVLGQLYGVGMSLADLAAATAVTGGFSSAGNVKNVGKAFQSALKSSEAGILALFGTRAATSALTDAAERGATDLQALIYGIMNGAAEVVFEKVSLDSLISMSNQKTIRSLVKNALKQSTIEGSEEVFTTIANTMSDLIIMGDKSDIISSINEGKDVALDWFKGLAWDYINGAISGGVSGGVTSTLSYLTQPPAEVTRDSIQPQDAVLNTDSSTTPFATPQNAAQSTVNTTATQTPAQTNNVAQASVTAQNIVPDGMGAMSPNFPYIETQSQTKAADSITTRADKEMLGQATHKLLTNEESRAQANERMQFDYDAEKEALATSEWGAAETVMGFQYLAGALDEYHRTGDKSEAIRMKKLFDEKGTIEGQALQARKQFVTTAEYFEAEAMETLEGDNIRKLSPQKKSDIIETVRSQAKAYNDIESGDVQSLVDLIKRNNEIRRTTGLLRTTTSKQMSFALDWVMNNAENAESFLRDIAVAQIRNIASDYQKISKLEAFKSYRVMGMLSKAAAVVRNLTTNMITDPLTTLSRDMVVPIDMLLSKVTGTRSVPLDKSWLSSAKRQGSLDGAMRSFIQVGLDVDVTDSTSKYEQRTGRVFKMTGSFLERLMSTWAKYEGYALHTADEFQKGGIRAEEQRGLNALRDKGKIAKDALLDRPTEEAKERTFQADSLAAQGAGWIRKGLNKFGITDKQGGTFGAGDLLMTFAVVPANLATQTAKFSPIGLVNGIKDLARVLVQAKKGTLNPALQAQAANNIGKGLTGTMGIAMATVLALKGIISVAGSDDKNKEAFEKGEGKTGTQLNLSALSRWVKGESTEWQKGDYIVSIGYMEIINSWLITGVMLADEMKADGNISIGDVGTASLSATAQSVLDMPVMQQLNDLVNGYKYSDAEKIGGKIADAAKGFAASQASTLIPNFLGGIAQAADNNTARNPYASDNLWQQTLYSLMSKTPGLRDNVPASIDPFGNPRTSNEGAILNTLNSNILPGYITSYKPYEISNQLNAITEAIKNTDLATRSVYPERKAPENFTKNETQYTLTAQEQQEYQKIYGQTYNKKVLDLINNKTQYDDKYFKNMTAEEKAHAIFDIKSEATDIAKQTYVESKGGMYLDKDEAAKVQTYISVGLSEQKAYGLFKDLQALKPLPGEDYVSKYQRITTILKQQIPQPQKVRLIAQYFTEHDKDGNVTKESLLPSLKNSDRLISLYSQTKDSQMVSMSIPSSFQYEKKTYSLTSADKRLFRETYLKIFNASMSPDITAEEVAKLRDAAYTEAKLAVLDKKLS